MCFPRRFDGHSGGLCRQYLEVTDNVVIPGRRGTERTPEGAVWCQDISPVCTAGKKVIRGSLCRTLGEAQEETAQEKRQ